VIRTGADVALRAVLGTLLYFPSREILESPAEAGLGFRDLALETEDGEQLHGWWIGSGRSVAGHLVFCHGNGGNIGERVMNAALLVAAGFDVLLFDYRGYGQSTGRPDEEGTYRDARAARKGALAQPGVDPSRLFYLGESLGGAVALHLALESPPTGLILQSTFTSIRDVARRHYPFIPPFLVADAYPSLRLIAKLAAPLLMLHGGNDAIVPVAQGQALFDAAPGRKHMHVFPSLGHNDLVAMAAGEYERVIAQWVRDLDS
jgi:fermentation-respiration switch protein FrsA (DUF1100 family)